MRSRSAWMIGVAAAVCAVVGIGAASQGETSEGKDAPKRETVRAGDPPGTTYTFVDTNLTRDKWGLTYKLPKIPAGPYAVSLFSGLEPTGDAINDNLGCQLGDDSGTYRTLVLTTQFNSVDATFVTGASTLRVTKDSKLTVSCFAEHGPFNFNSDPLRVSFTRLASMQVQKITPDSVVDPGR